MKVTASALRIRIGEVPSSPDPIPWHDLDETESTMEYAASLAAREAPGWIVVSARTQRSGRGTRGRSWHSPEGLGLWASVVMPPPGAAENLDGVTAAAAEALAASLGELTGVRFTVKHPNDVLSRGKKVAGILIETVVCENKVVSVILGMGVNIGQTAAEFEEAGLPDATSLRIESGVRPDRIRVLESFLGRFRPLYETFAFPADKPIPHPFIPSPMNGRGVQSRPD